jgi:hypothetical protein
MGRVTASGAGCSAHHLLSRRSSLQFGGKKRASNYERDDQATAPGNRIQQVGQRGLESFFVAAVAFIFIQ